VNVDEIGALEFRHAWNIEGAEKVNVVQSDGSGDASKKFFDMRSAWHRDRISLYHIATEDAGLDVVRHQSVAQTVHLNLTTAGMAIATVHEQDFPGVNARGKFPAIAKMVRGLVMHPHHAMA